jgi:hypothetical protein
MVFFIPRKKVLLPGHSEFRGRANSEARNGTERTGIPRKNEVLRNSLNTEQNQRPDSQTTYYSENKVFCFELFTVVHLFGFHPNPWFSSPQFGGFSTSFL